MNGMSLTKGKHSGAATSQRLLAWLEVGRQYAKKKKNVEAEQRQAETNHAIMSLAVEMNMA